jgi:hypothetical protein
MVFIPGFSRLVMPQGSLRLHSLHGFRGGIATGGGADGERDGRNARSSSTDRCEGVSPSPNSLMRECFPHPARPSASSVAPAVLQLLPVRQSFPAPRGGGSHGDKRCSGRNGARAPKVRRPPRSSIPGLPGNTRSGIWSSSSRILTLSPHPNPIASGASTAITRRMTGWCRK